MTVSQPRIEVKEAASGGWFGAREEARLPVHGARAGGSAGTFEAPDASAGNGSGRTWLRRVRRALFDLALVVAAMTAVPVWTVAVTHGTFWRTRFTMKYSPAQLVPTGAERALTVPADPSITPAEAGSAYLALLGAQSSEDFPVPGGSHAEVTRARLFAPRSMLQPDSRGRMHMPSESEMMEAASHGFPPEELAYFRKISASAEWRTFDIVARAPAIDIVGGRFRLPFTRDATMWNMPVMQANVFQSLAMLGIRRAAYHLAIGQRDSAETVLRLIVSFGVRLGDNAPTIGEQFAGREVAETGMEALERFYIIMHDPRAMVVRAARSNGEAISAGNFGSLPSRNVATDEAMRLDLIRRSEDPREARSIRFASLEALSLAPCTNVREMLFGPNADVRDAFERAKHDLARYPSEQAFIDLIQRMPNSTALPDNELLPAFRQFLVGASTIAGAALHNPRLAGCALIATQGNRSYY